MHDMRERIVETLTAHHDMIKASIADDTFLDSVERAVLVISESLCAGGTVFTFGNGGSAADAQHIAAEIVGRFKATRPGLPAIALVTDGAVMTSLANDFGYDKVFSRQIEGLGREGDIALAISTSGTSPNILAAVETARDRGMQVVALTGSGGGELASRSDAAIMIPSDDTPVIQEGHMAVYHIICGLVEQAVCALPGAHETS
jgi:D-sedoheptulose 7-phosphate isomerase